MIYPKGEVLHQNLSTEYTDVPQLLATFKTNDFSGVVEIEIGGMKSAFFAASGKVINAAIGVESDPPAMVGEEAIEELLNLASQSKGTLNIYQAPALEVEFAASTLMKSELLFKNLNTDFVRMDLFIKKHADEKLTGYIEIFTKMNQRIGTLSLRDGEIAGLQVLSESGPPCFFDQEGVSPLLDEIMRHGAIFSVYRNLSAPIQKKSGAEKKAKAAKTEEPVTEVEKAPVIEFKTEPVIEFKTEPIVEKKAEPVIELKTEPAPGKSEVRTEKQNANNGVGQDRNMFLQNLQDVLFKMERFIDGVSTKGSFQRVFNATCIEKSDLYHFLDPFEGQFEYNEKKVRVDDRVETERFAMAIADCLNHTLLNIQKEIPNDLVLPAELKGETESVFTHYHDMIRFSGLQSVVPPSLQ